MRTRRGVPEPGLLAVLGLTILFLPQCRGPILEFSVGIAVEDVAVIDVQEGRVLRGMTVVIEGSRISAVEPSPRIRLGEGVERIQGRGMYLIPGLWDMHVHAVDPFSLEMLPLFVANGVTGIRDMWGDLDTAKEVQGQIGAGEQIGPRFLVPGHYIDGPHPWWEGSVTAGSPEEGRSAVDSLAEAGAAFIKVGSLLDPPVFRAILERAVELGLSVAGHVPFNVSAVEASELGMASVEHLFGVMEGCSIFDTELRADRVDWMAARAAGEDAPNPVFDVAVFQRVSDGFDADLCGSLADLLARNDTWQVPTLTVIRPGAFGFDSTFTNDPRLVYMPAGIKDEWAAIVARYRSSTSPDDISEEHDWYLTLHEVIRVLRDRGVPILAGTDAPNPFVFFGFSLHDELELLVEAGLSPTEALQAATLNPSKFLEATDSLGLVAPGKLADLVLLTGNPLEEISNTREIQAVFLNGRPFTRSELDQMLSEAKAWAESQT
jgi:imidazolonepropionase-like amidohydrolase